VLKEANVKIILAPISLGELVDKITILKIKISKLDTIKLALAKNELDLLNVLYQSLEVHVKDDLIKILGDVNLKLWEIEDAIREKESSNSFDIEFINLARSVYIENDKRAEIKNKINILYGSIIRDQKSYKTY